MEGKTAEPGASCPCREHTGHNRGKPGPDQTNTFAFPEAGGTLERMKQVCVLPAEAPLLQKIGLEGFFIERPRAEEDPTSPMPWCATRAAIR